MTQGYSQAFFINELNLSAGQLPQPVYPREYDGLEGFLSIDLRISIKRLMRDLSLRFSVFLIALSRL